MGFSIRSHFGSSHFGAEPSAEHACRVRALAMASLAGVLSDISQAGLSSRDRKRLQWQAVAASTPPPVATGVLEPPELCPIDVLDEVF